MPNRPLSFVALMMLFAGIAYPAAAADQTSKPSTVLTSMATAKPTAVCGNPAILNGPTSPPAGAVVFNPVTNLNDATRANPAGATFYLTGGSHLLGTSEYGQVIPKDGNTYIGAPGAVLDGKGINRYAFTQHARGVRIAHLTVTGFRPPLQEAVVNQSAGTGWTIERNTIVRNGGAGLFIGSDNVVRQNCLKENSQYGASMYKPAVAPGYGPAAITNIVLDGNEIVGNNTGNHEWKADGTPSWCGCTGGVKFWDVGGATITNNWVHHNKSVGLWADTNNVDFRVENNVIEDNDHVGFWYEISYNFRVANNTFNRNGLVEGQRRQAIGDGFPIGAIYIAESGGESRPLWNGHVPAFPVAEIVGNTFTDNWDGVVLWEASERFCNSPGNTSAGSCTKVNPQVTHDTCVEGTIEEEPYYSDCRWMTQNIRVTGNTFTLTSKAAIGCTAGSCGRNTLLASWGTAYPTWSPYLGFTVPERIAFASNNVFANNTYEGPWTFSTAWGTVDFATWQASPYNQDTGSTHGG